MKLKQFYRYVFVFLLSVFVFTGCGSDNGGGAFDANGEPTGSSSVEKITIKGKVVDDPIEDATIEVYDANQIFIEKFKNTSDENGNFSIDVNKKYSLPLLLKVTDGEINGTKFDDVMYGVCFEKSCNITPITTTLSLSFIANLTSSKKEDFAKFASDYLGISDWQSISQDEIVNFRKYMKDNEQGLEYIASSIANDIADGYIDNVSFKTVFPNAKFREDKSSNFEIDKEAIENVANRNLKLVNLVTGEESEIDGTVSYKSYGLELALVEKLEYELYDGTPKTKLDIVYLPFEPYSETKLDSYSTIFNLVFKDLILSTLNSETKKKLIEVVLNKYNKELENTKKMHLLYVNEGDMHLRDFETSIKKLQALLKSENINTNAAIEHNSDVSRSLKKINNNIDRSMTRSTYQDTFNEKINFGGISVEHTSSNTFNIRNILPMYWGLTSLDGYNAYNEKAGDNFFNLSTIPETFQHNLINASSGGGIGLGAAVVWEKVFGNKLAGNNTPMNCEEFDGALCDGSKLYADQTGKYVFYKRMGFDSLQGILNVIDAIKNVIGGIPAAKPDAIKKMLDKAKKADKIAEGIADTAVSISMLTDVTVDILDMLANASSSLTEEEKGEIQEIIGNYKNVKGNIDELISLLSSFSLDRDGIENNKYEKLLDGNAMKKLFEVAGIKKYVDFSTLFTLPTVAKTKKQKAIMILESLVLYIGLGDQEIFEKEYDGLDKGSYFVDDSLLHQIFFTVNKLATGKKTVSRRAYADTLVKNGYLQSGKTTRYALDKASSRIISFLFNGKNLSVLKGGKLAKISNSFQTLLKKLKADFSFLKFVTKTGDAISHINWQDGVKMITHNILIPMWYSALDNVGTEFRGFAVDAITNGLIKFATPYGISSVVVKGGNELAGKVIAMTAYPNKIAFELETKENGTIDFKTSVPVVINFESGIVLPWRDKDKIKRDAFLKADTDAPYVVVTKEKKSNQSYFLPSHRVNFGTTKDLLESYLDNYIDESKFLEVHWNEKICDDSAIKDSSIDINKCSIFTNGDGLTNDLSGSYTGEELDNDYSYVEDEFIKNSSGHASLDYVDILSKKLCEDATTGDWRCSDEDSSGFMFVYNKTRGIFVDVVKQQIYGAKSSVKSAVDSPEQYTTLFKIADLSKIKLDIKTEEDKVILTNGSDIPLSLIVINSSSAKSFSSYKTYDKLLKAKEAIEITYEELEKYIGNKDGSMDIDILVMDSILDSYKKFMKHSRLIDTLQMMAINAKYSSLETFVNEYSKNNLYSFIKKEHISLEKVNHRPTIEPIEIIGDKQPAPAEVTFNIKATDEDDDALECWIKYTKDSEAVKLDSCEESVKHTYTKDGNYQIELIAKDANGLEATYFDTVRMFNKNLDVVMLVDLSSSYSDDLSTFRARSQEIVDAIKTKLPDYDLKIGITSFDDYPINPYGSSGDYAFKKELDLTHDISTFKSKLNELRVYGGGDGPEAQLEGIYQTIKEITWDDNAQKIILFFTDASFHDKDKYSEDSSYPGHGSTETKELIDDEGVYIIGLASGRMTEDMEQISDFEALMSSNSSEVVDKILEELSVFSTDKISSKMYRKRSLAMKVYSRDEYLGEEN